MAYIYKRSKKDPRTSRSKEGQVWWVAYMQNGEQVRRSLGVTDRKMAELMKAEIEQNIERGKAGLPQSIVDVYELFEEFKRAVILKKSANYARRMFQQLKPFLEYLQGKNMMNLARVTVTDVEKFLAGRAPNLSPKSWNDELRLIERFFRFAVDRDYLAKNPAAKIAKVRVAKSSIEIFTPEELGLIFKYAHHNSVAFYKMLLYTGMRDGEARYLQWKDVVLESGNEHIRIRNTAVHLTKTRKDRVVPLCAEAVELLREIRSVRNSDNPFVFPGKMGNGPKGHNRNTWVACLNRIEEATGIRIAKGRYTTGVHLFRHTFATNALASGVDIRTVQDWLGHSTILMTQRYTNLLPNQKQVQIHKLAIEVRPPSDADSDSLPEGGLA